MYMDFYYYNGTSTEPPLEAEKTWIVFNNPVSMSEK
jgi:carbonic anhydrase